jgi:hypothetical protein
MERASVTSSKLWLEFPGEPIGNGGFHGQLMPLQIMKTTQRNPYRISATEALENEGFSDTPESLEAFARHALFDATSPACCSEGCIVEPDGTCSHGCPSILIALGMI